MKYKISADQKIEPESDDDGVKILVTENINNRSEERPSMKGLGLSAKAVSRRRLF
jgi:hypothetical protein